MDLLYRTTDTDCLEAFVGDLSKEGPETFCRKCYGFEAQLLNGLIESDLAGRRRFADHGFEILVHGTVKASKTVSSPSRA